MAKNSIIAVWGVVCLLAGIVLVLREWANLLIVFKGLIGVILAVAGLFMLFLVGGKSSKT
jgi:hypothetical protein